MSLLLAAAVVAAPIPKTLEYDGFPPPRFQRAEFSAKFTFTRDLNKHCGTPPPDKRWGGCVRNWRLYVPNPCDYKHEEFARFLCHEMGHKLGWGREHGE